MILNVRRNEDSEKNPSHRWSLHFSLHLISLLLLQCFIFNFLIIIIIIRCSGIFRNVPCSWFYRQPKICKIFWPLINSGNRTEWSPIRCVIIRVITKSHDRAAGVRFVYHKYDCRPNWTTRSLITN